jgi:hypothetical protein
LWYRLETARQGVLTVEAAFEGAPESVALALYSPDRSEPPLVVSTLLDGSQRIDWQVGGGETYYLKLTGGNTNVDVRLCNLVKRDLGRVTVSGTDEGDQFEYAPEGSHRITIKGVDYHFEDGEVTSIEFLAGIGQDSATLYGSADSEVLTVHPTTATLMGNGIEVNVTDVERVVAAGGGGHDTANFHGTADVDAYTGNQDYGRLTNHGFLARASGFAECYVDLKAGDDIARLYDSPGDDTLTADPTQATLNCPDVNVLHQVQNFRELHAFAEQDGHDTAQLADDPAEESYVVSFHALAGTEAKLFDGDRHGSPEEVNQIVLIRTSGFESVTATAGAGDTALLYGTSGDEQYSGTATQASLTVPSGAVFTAASFEQIHSVAKGGKNNTAQLVGSSRKDRFWGTRTYGRLGGSGWLQRLVRYNQVTAYGGGGPDVAEMFDTRFTDTFSGWPDGCAYQAGRWEYRVQEFPVVRVNGEAAGSDMGHLYPGATDTVRERTDDWVMSGDGYSVTIEKSFGAVEVHDGSGSGSQSALAGTDEFSSQVLSNRDVALLADAFLRNRFLPDPDDDETAAVDSVLRTELWWNRM